MRSFAGASGSYARNGKVRGPALNPEELFYEVFATLYRNLGIDVKTAQLIDAAGRPKYLVDKRDVISELV